MRRALLAALVDACCLALFVLSGRQSHGLDTGIGWYGTVVWPFLAGWFALALVTALYVRRSHAPVRLAVTIAAGVALALVLRATVTHRDTPLAFVIVAYAFITLLTGGWRLVVAGVRRLRLARR